MSLEQGPGFIDRRLGPLAVLKHAVRPVQGKHNSLTQPARHKAHSRPFAAGGRSAPTGDSGILPGGSIWLLIWVSGGSTLDTALIQLARGF